MNQKLLALYGLKWNPFSPELPTEAVYVPPRVENFCWRIEQALIREGGFAMIHGDPGTGKSVALRLLAQRLSRLPDISVGVITHTLCDHAAGNYRILTTLAAELLAIAAQRELPLLDEKLYLEVFAPPERASPRRAAPGR